MAEKKVARGTVYIDYIVCSLAEKGSMFMVAFLHGYDLGNLFTLSKSLTSSLTFLLPNNG